VVGFRDKQIAVRLRDFARDKLNQSYTLDVAYPKPRLVTGGNTLWIGKLVANVNDCDVDGGQGTLNIWEQIGTDCPQVISPTKQMTVLNITGFTLKTGHFMYAQKIKYFNQPLVFPAQIQACP